MKENNIILANFMGYRKQDSDKKELVLYEVRGKMYFIDELAFDKSWEWIMPVLLRITRIEWCSYNLSGGQCIIRWEDRDKSGNTVGPGFEVSIYNKDVKETLEVAHEAAVVFVKKWNQKNGSNS